MPRKPASKPDNAEQSKRFIETAEEVGADTDDEALERAFKKIVPAPHFKKRLSSCLIGTDHRASGPRCLRRLMFAKAEFFARSRADRRGPLRKR